MFTKSFSYLSDVFIFIFIFSLFNDNFIIDHAGEGSLKILFFMFFIFYFLPMLRNFKTMTAIQEKFFFAFFIANLTVFLLQIIINPMNDIAAPALLLIANFVIVLYFNRYPIQKLLYFIWMSMMISVVICYFNDPISEWTFRTSGGTADPNEFASQLLVLLFASFYLYTHNKNKIFLAVSTIFFIYGIFQAGSMSSFLVLGVIGAYSVIRLILVRPKLLFNYKVLLGLLFLIGIATQINLSNIETVANVLGRTQNTGTAYTRINSWIAGKHMIEENLLIGVGVNKYTNNTRKYAEVYLADDSLAPHNIFIKLFAESGIIAFGLFVIFIVYIIFSHFKLLFWKSEQLIILMLFSVLFMGMTLGILYDKYFWLLIAMVMHLNYQLKRMEV